MKTSQRVQTSVGYHVITGDDQSGHYKAYEVSWLRRDSKVSNRSIINLPFTCKVHEKMVVTQLLDLLRRTSLFEVSIFLYCWTSVDQSILLETLQQVNGIRSDQIH